MGFDWENEVVLRHEDTSSRLAEIEITGYLSTCGQHEDGTYI